MAALLVVGVLAAVPLVAIGGSFALATDSALPYYMMAVLPAVPALTLWLTRKPTLRAIATGLVIGAVSLAAQLFLTAFWAIGAALFALAVVLCVAPKRLIGKESGWSALGSAFGLILGVLALTGVVVYLVSRG
jgi:hypothetical protein